MSSVVFVKVVVRASVRAVKRIEMNDDDVFLAAALVLLFDAKQTNNNTA